MGGGPELLGLRAVEVDAFFPPCSPTVQASPPLLCLLAEESAQLLGHLTSPHLASTPPDLEFSTAAPALALALAPLLTPVTWIPLGKRRRQLRLPSSCAHFPFLG